MSDTHAETARVIDPAAPDPKAAAGDRNRAEKAETVRKEIAAAKEREQRRSVK